MKKNRKKSLYVLSSVCFSQLVYSMDMDTFQSNAHAFEQLLCNECIIEGNIRLAEAISSQWEQIDADWPAPFVREKLAADVTDFFKTPVLLEQMPWWKVYLNSSEPPTVSYYDFTQKITVLTIMKAKLKQILNLPDSDKYFVSNQDDAGFLNHMYTSTINQKMNNKKEWERIGTLCTSFKYIFFRCYSRTLDNKRANYWNSFQQLKTLHQYIEQIRKEAPFVKRSEKAPLPSIKESTPPLIVPLDAIDPDFIEVTL